MSFNNKVVIVTGASSGIGAAIALKFVSEGAKVTVVGRNEKKLNSVLEQCEKLGSKPLVVLADVAKEQDAKRIIDDTISHFGKLDVLINNAGIGGNVNILADEAMQVFDKVMATNLRSVVYLTHLAGKHLIETKGNIINISSMAALRVFACDMFSYSTSKAALDQFSRSVALDFASKGVRVNTINPGPVRTDIIENMGMPTENVDAAWENLKKSTPLKRISDSNEIAELTLFLAGDKAVGITGSSFVVDNGFLVKNEF